MNLNRLTRQAIVLPLVCCGLHIACAADTPVAPTTLPNPLPGKGLSQHDFFYAGEGAGLRMSIVRGGSVVWSYTHPGPGEISDAILEPNSHILFAHQFGVTEVTLDKQVVWNYDAPPKTEIHTAQPLGTNRVWFIQNGAPAKFVVMDKASGKVEREFTLPSVTNNVHGQFRHARMTSKATLLVAHMDLGKAAEYDMDGKELWSVNVPGAWSASELTNGNVLVVSNRKFIREINRAGETVWEWTSADAPGYKIDNLQLATRLPNGNTLINNWASLGRNTDPTNGPVQAIEVTPSKNVVWALRSWKAPADLGPSTTIQLLDDHYGPDTLPGAGLAQHPFLYVGELDSRKPAQFLYIVRDGKVAWSYDIPNKDANGEQQEFSDATMLSNGNIIFGRKTGAGIVTPEKKLIWNYDAPKGTEVHSVQPLGTNRVMFVQNGNPAKLFIVDIATGKTEKELTLPTPHPNNPHLQFRRVRQTAQGTFLAAHLDDNKVCEYDADGKLIWSVAAPGAWSAARLKNGNTLISCYPDSVREVNPKGETVWEFNQKDVPDIKLFIVQESDRLANGNTVICNWCAGTRNVNNSWNRSVQLLEVTPEKKLVWALRSWNEPADLGPATTIQLLDQPGVPENPGEQAR